MKLATIALATLTVITLSACQGVPWIGAESTDLKDIPEPGSLSTKTTNVQKILVALDVEGIYGEMAGGVVENNLSQMGFQVIADSPELRAQVDQVMRNPYLAKGENLNAAWKGAQGIVMLRITRVDVKDSSSNQWGTTSKVTALMKFVDLKKGTREWGSEVSETYKGDGDEAVKAAVKRMMGNFPRRAQ